MGYSKEKIEQHIYYAEQDALQYEEPEKSLAHSSIALAMIQFNCMEMQCGDYEIEQNFIEKIGGSNAKLSE